MANIAEIVNNLRQERVRAAQELEQLDQAIAALGNLGGQKEPITRGGVSRPRRTLSPAARRKLSLAQKARWAKVKSGTSTGVQTGSAKPGKRVMSAASRKKIAAAKRVWWAKKRAQQKKAA